MSGHTPGPWHIGMQPGPIIYGKNGEQVADLRGERKTLVVELDEAVANTKLISAAPELLEALKACRKSIRHAHNCKAPQAFPCSCDADSLWKQSEEAIERAER